MKLLLLFVSLLSYGLVADSLLTQYCKLRRRFQGLDLMIAIGVTPVEDRFPFNLFQTSRTPDPVTQLVKGLLPGFDYLSTRVSIVNMNGGYQSIVGFNSNRYRTFTTFRRWEPSDQAPEIASSLTAIRQAFQNNARANSEKVLIILTDQISADIAASVTAAQLTRADGIKIITVGYGDAFINPVELEALSGTRRLTVTANKLFYLPKQIHLIHRILCAVISIPIVTPFPTVPIESTPAVTQSPTQAATTQEVTQSPTQAATTTTPGTTPNPIVDEILILADTSESTRDFLNLTYFYNDDYKGFLRSAITNTDFTQCGMGLLLFSDNVLTLGDLSSDQTTLLNAVDNIDSNQQAEFGRTSLTRAVTTASVLLLNSPNPSASKTIIILTDGQPVVLAQADLAINRAKSSGIRFGVVQSPLFDGQIGYRPNDFSSMFTGEERRILTARSELNSVISSSFCPIGATIFD